MKYCPKCGKELSSSAKYCDNCGNRVPFDDEHYSTVSRQNYNAIKAKTSTAFILIVIALLMGIFSGIAIFQAQFQYSFGTPPEGVNVEEDNLWNQLVGYDTSQIQTDDEAVINWITDEENRKEKNRDLYITLTFWTLQTIATFAAGCLALFKTLDAKKTKNLGYVYLLLSLSIPIVYLIRNPDYILFMLCMIGAIIYIPTIISVVAAIKIINIANMKA